jgi:hypothetical protein
MTKRLYTSQHAPSFQPTLQGTWSTQSALVYREFGQCDGPVAGVTQTKTNASTTWDMALICYLIQFPYSGTIPVLSPVFDFRYGRVASVASAIVAKWHVWLSTGATSTPRVTISANGVSGTNWVTSPVFSFLGINCTGAISVTAGDYLVIEFGARGITSSTTVTATIDAGGLGVDPVSGDAVTNQPGWLDCLSTADTLVNAIPVPGTPLMMAA